MLAVRRFILLADHFLLLADHFVARLRQLALQMNLRPAQFRQFPADRFVVGNRNIKTTRRSPGLFHRRLWRSHLRDAAKDPRLR